MKISIQVSSRISLYSHSMQFSQLRRIRAKEILLVVLILPKNSHETCQIVFFFSVKTKLCTGTHSYSNRNKTDNYYRNQATYLNYSDRERVMPAVSIIHIDVQSADNIIKRNQETVIIMQ